MCYRKLKQFIKNGFTYLILIEINKILSTKYTKIKNILLNLIFPIRSNHIIKIINSTITYFKIYIHITYKKKKNNWNLILQIKFKILIYRIHCTYYKIHTYM